MRLRTPPAPSEHQEQARVIRFARLFEPTVPAFRWLFAVPNGARVSRSQANKLSREGMQAGTPDLWLPVRSSGGVPGLVIEMKRRPGPKGGANGSVVAPEQREWLDFLAAQGWTAAVAQGAEQAWHHLCLHTDAPDAVWRAMQGPA